MVTERIAPIEGRTRSICGTKASHNFSRNIIDRRSYSVSAQKSGKVIMTAPSANKMNNNYLINCEID